LHRLELLLRRGELGHRQVQGGETHIVSGETRQALADLQHEALEHELREADRQREVLSEDRRELQEADLQREAHEGGRRELREADLQHEAQEKGKRELREADLRREAQEEGWRELREDQLVRMRREAKGEQARVQEGAKLATPQARPGAAQAAALRVALVELEVVQEGSGPYCGARVDAGGGPTAREARKARGPTWQRARSCPASVLGA
jgi:hypothetical protein